MTIHIDKADLTGLLEQGARVLYSGDEGTVELLGDDDALLVSDIEDGDALRARLQALTLPTLGVAEVKSLEAATVVKELFDFSYIKPCSQWVYTLPTAPAIAPCDIRLLPEELLPLAAAHYHPEEHNLGYLTERRALGQLWGLFENGELAGFIGTHGEGSMGILEILPPYRGRGYGYTLEAFLIGWKLAHGQTPFCHVVEGNLASEHLQRKLGLTRADLPAFWVVRD